MGNVSELKDSDFEQEVLSCANPVVVDFWATWCGPCRKLGPVIEEISESYVGKVRFVIPNGSFEVGIFSDVSKQYVFEAMN